VIALKEAETDLSDLQNMVRESDPNKAVENAYTLKKAQRDINMITEDVRKYRQFLVDLAGPDALAKLDKQMDQEQLAIDPALAEAQKEQMGATEPAEAQSASTDAVKDDQAATAIDDAPAAKIAGKMVKPKEETSTTVPDDSPTQ
jgi:hypothetical protein